jgi:NDP-4-keto-2,6-dideoxyhexose 3-C-methyltransferase
MKILCRICSSQNIESFLDLGTLALTGKYADPGIEIDKHPLNLGKCLNCGLVQLMDNFRNTDLYGPGYGYESHLNDSMKLHLQSTAKYIEKRFKPSMEDVIVDIASNDGTLLSGYSNENKNLIGIDPLIDIFTDKYPAEVVKINEFFSKEVYFKRISRKAKIITSFSVFYDLEDPILFTRDIENILEEDGVWILEQSYLPTMINSLGFDTICHEHLLYLSLTDFEQIFEQVGLEIFDVKINDINGGSIQLYVKKSTNFNYLISPYVEWLLSWEKSTGITSFENCKVFAKNVKNYSIQLRSLIESYKDLGYFIFGLGASTKGNVLLQYCNLGELIEEIGEINPKKFGKVTPGTNIPIVNQNKLIGSQNLDTTKQLGIIIPWHFRNSIINSAGFYLSKGGSLLVPLPFPEIV